MDNENNIPMTASHMLFHELVANNGAKLDSMNLAEARKRQEEQMAKVELRDEVKNVEGKHNPPF